MNKSAPRTYPYDAWVLLPSFKPAKVTITSVYGSHIYNDWDLSESGKAYGVSELFETKEAAINCGYERIASQEAIERKRRIAIDKRIAALKKAV